MLGAYHKIRNKSNLTVVMFHRVVPLASPEWASADHDYTLPTDLFEKCVTFFTQHYNIISLSQLEQAADSGLRLPPRPLLITFDDGWSDTCRHAAPLLCSAGLPAACFVVADVLDDVDNRWWHDTYTRAWRRDGATPDRSWGALENPRGATSAQYHFDEFFFGLIYLHKLPVAARSEALIRWWGEELSPTIRQMLTVEQIKTLVDFGVSIGSHGATHIPLTLCESPPEELRRSRTRLELTIAGTAQSKITAVSFPHGRFSEDIVRTSRDAGYQLTFTSEKNLIRLVGKAHAPDRYGRIEIATGHITDEKGRYRPDLLATHLFTRTAL
jgi:peptidoglycan/xylan/chitin deacetylase (PgdA/CDA1 family)